MILANLSEEQKLRKTGFRVLAGVDEVGRGALAGPVVAAAVGCRRFRILRKNPPPIPIRDSKHLSPKQRELLYEWLARQPEFAVAIARVSSRTIDTINIRRAALTAMRRAVVRLPMRPDALLIDGIDRPFPGGWHQRTYIRGDERIFLIALASIAAKVTRDRLMTRLAHRYPGYGFEVHKGYGTHLHRKAIRRLGPLPIHRRSFL